MVVKVVPSPDIIDSDKGGVAPGRMRARKPSPLAHHQFQHPCEDGRIRKPVYAEFDPERKMTEAREQVVSINENVPGQRKKGDPKEPSQDAQRKICPPCRYQ